VSATEPLWGVGCYRDAAGARVTWEITHDAMHEAMGAAGRALADLGVGAGDRVLFCSLLSEAGHFWPFIVASMLAGAQISKADATEADAVRVHMFLRRTEPTCVFGIDERVLDGLEQLEGYDGLEETSGVGALLGRVRTVVARPGAYERLAAAGLAPYRLEIDGPAVALAREPGGPAVTVR
jgi:acyl-coenzyme A synthetase/AMP-(fatty) acid ligase